MDPGWMTWLLSGLLIVLLLSIAYVSIDPPSRKRRQHIRTPEERYAARRARERKRAEAATMELPVLTAEPSFEREDEEPAA